MRIFMALILVAITMPSFALADCCGCCVDREPTASDKPAAKVAPVSTLDDAANADGILGIDVAAMQTFDGSTAPLVVTLAPRPFAIYKGSLADPKGAILKAVGLASSEKLFNGHNEVWSLVPLKQDAATIMPTMEYWPAVSLDPGQHASGELSDYTTPGGKYMLAANRGAYEQLPQTWARFAAFADHNANVDTARPTMEFYYSDPGTTPPADVVTLLYIPIN